eukprot:scaffold522_cov168-Amphora_coffeaeformis.AAC.11
MQKGVTLGLIGKPKQAPNNFKQPPLVLIDEFVGHHCDMNGTRRQAAFDEGLFNMLHSRLGKFGNHDMGKHTAIWIGTNGPRIDRISQTGKYKATSSRP